MPKCLGVYIEDDVIKYAKVDKNKDMVKVESSSVVFYEKDNIAQTLDRIIRETFSAKDTISINVSNELYNYFEVFSALKPADKKKSVDLDFELLCSEKGYNKDSLESRNLFIDSEENPDKSKVVHIAANKENIRKRIQDFGGMKVTNVSPITTSIFNLLDLGPKEDNVVIVNIEKDTKVTTIIGGEIYNVDIIPEGMGEILDAINATENSLKKSYECCKNTTIYTQEMQELQTTNENEHLDEIMPVLYKIVSEVRTIVGTSIKPVSKVYVTGLGTAINNVDLYFQEYIQSAKCELLRPFFLENASVKIQIKDYIEVNSAIALALDGLGFGKKELNFRNNKGSAGVSLNSKALGNSIRGFLDPSQELTVLDKTLLRVLVLAVILVFGYIFLTDMIVGQIDEKQKEVALASDTVDAQMAVITEQSQKIAAGQKNYDDIVSALTATDTSSDDTTVDDENKEPEIVITKNSIPNLLNRIVAKIPGEVKVTSIKNTEGKHIVINAESNKYDQLGYFRAALSTSGTLLNVKSTSGVRSGATVSVTIEGDLP